MLKRIISPRLFKFFRQFGREALFIALPLVGIVSGGLFAGEDGPAATRTSGFLPSKPITVFAEKYADPFTVQMGLSKSLDANQFIGRIGQEIYIYRFGKGVGKRRGSVFYLGMNGHTWSLLGRTGNKFPLRAVDFLISAFLEWHSGPFSGRVNFSHISAHLGDKFSLGGNLTRKPRTYSQEFFSGILAYGTDRGTVYGGLHYLNHTIPDLKSVNFQAGGTVHLFGSAKKRWNPYFSLDLRTSGQDSYHLNQSYQWGVRFGALKSHAFRLAATWYQGHSFFGQFFNESRDFVSAGFFFDY